MACPSARVTGLVTAGILGVGAWLPGFPAAAQTLAATYETTANPPLAWLAPTGSTASTAPDGVDSSVELSVYGASDVTQVAFAYRATGSDPWTLIGVATRVADAFSIEWTPPASTGSSYSVRAVPAVPTAGGLVSGRAATKTISWSSAVPAVHLGASPGSTLPFYRQSGSGPDAGKQYVGVTGTVSASTPDETGSFGAPNTDTTVTVSSPNFPSAAAVDSTVAYSSGTTPRSWSSVLVVPGSDVIVAGGNDRLVLHAGSTSGAGAAGGDAAAVYTLVEQQVGVVTAVPQVETIQVQSCWLLGCTTTNKNIDVLQGQVVDSTSGRNPVAGVRIRAVKVGDPSVTVTGVRAGADGRFTLLNTSSSSDGDLPSGQYRVFADLGDDGTFTDGVDPSWLTTVGMSTASVAVLGVTSVDGDAFDPAESGAQDLYVDVTNEKGDGIAATVSYQWAATYAGGSTDTFPVQTVASAASPVGRAYIPRPSDADGHYTLTAWVDKNSSGGLDATDPQTVPLTLAWGQAHLAFDSGTSVLADAGSDVTVTGLLNLWDGTPLPGRSLTTDFSGSTEYLQPGNTPATGDAAFADWQPSGTTLVSSSQTTSLTDSDGAFAVTLSDPATDPQNEERDGVLTSTASGPGVTTEATTSFLLDTTLTALTVDGTADVFDDNTGSTTDERTPGRPVVVTFTGTNAFGSPLPGAVVDVSVNRGFLTPNPDTSAYPAPGLTPAETPTDGAEYGVWENLGTTTQVHLDRHGQGKVTVAIERDSAFDRSLGATVRVSISSGRAATSSDISFKSKAPFNVDALTVAVDSSSESQVLPSSRVGQRALLDVTAFDQFGNPVRGQAFTADDGGSPATVSGNTGGPMVTGLAGDLPQLVAESDAATTQTIVVSKADAPRTLWVDGDPGTAGFQAARGGTTNDGSLSGDADAIDWYAGDPATSVFTLTDNVGGRQYNGQPATVTATAVDQLGQPYSDLTVVFKRSGSAGSQTKSAALNRSGLARYGYTSKTAGEATVQAVFKGSDGGVLKTLSDTITWVAPIRISATMTGTNAPSGADRLRIKASSRLAHGAAVRVFRLTDSGKLVKVGQGRLNKRGIVVLTVADGNGGAVTNYVAKVLRTPRTKATHTNWVTLN